MKPLVSVILPTYNVEKYLKQCIESVVSQSYKNIEIIIVIDGATDNSYEIAKSYEKKDERVKVIYQENAGSGPARNNGLLHARGEYVIFIDPDDWVEQKMVEAFIDVMEETGADLLTSRAINVFYDDQGNEIERVKNKCVRREFSTVEDVRNNYCSLYMEHLLGAPTKKVYRMDLIREHQIEFPDLRRSQDIVFNYRYYEHVKKVYVSEETLYYYRINKKNNVLKLPDQYYQTVILIHNGILEMNKRWDRTITDQERVGYNNVFLDRIERCVEARIMKGMSFEDILSDATVKEVIKAARPNRIDKRIERVLICNNCVWLLSVIINFKQFLRSAKNSFI